MTTHSEYVLGKVDYNNSGRKNCKAVLTWTWDGKRFAMQGEIWNPRETDVYTCGQCVAEVVAYFPHDAKAQRMLAVWQRWHLNDTRAGSLVQEDYLRQHPIGNVSDYYKVASDALAQANLNPDPKGYVYGQAWTFEALPADVIAEIESWDK